MAKRLLWIEDDAGPLASLLSEVRKDGWEVKCVYTEEEVHDLLPTDDEWDVIVLDVILPERENPSLRDMLSQPYREFVGLDVLDFVNQYYRQAGRQPPPVIGLTKVSDDRVVTRLLDLGAREVLVKGSRSPNDVRAAVAKAVGQG